MKKCWFLLTVLCLAVTGTALAQQVCNQKTTTKVPFDFVVNDTMLPAGTYDVSFYTTGHTLMMQNRNMPRYVTIAINTQTMYPLGDRHEDTRFVFGVSNGQHVLHQIKLAGDDHTHDIVHRSDVAELIPNR